MAGGGDPRRPGPAIVLRRLGDDLPVRVGQVRPVEGEEHPVLAGPSISGGGTSASGLRVSCRHRQGQQRDTDEERFHLGPPDSWL